MTPAVKPISAAPAAWDEGDGGASALAKNDPFVLGKTDPH
jgi:hypothetical protein